MMSERTTAPIVMARVSVVRSHMPSMPHSSMRNMLKNAMRSVDVA